MAIHGDAHGVQQVQDKKEDRRVRRTKKLLTQALTQLLQEKQINEITVKELTDLADMNRGTFYLYYRDMFDMLEKVEDGLFGALDEIISVHGNNDVMTEAKMILVDLFRFIGDNREMCRVLLSPHGDMNFLHRLNEVLREKCLMAWHEHRQEKDEAEFDYHYSFIVFGCAGLIRAWVNRDCQESPETMAKLAFDMVLRGSMADV
ncbi:MAG: TetR family transcriptional regulator C-terminal domain-containing protein [Clostridia bacterium]|nr:TetR family transcriptional regulator C-terminal domain-containing protein [Clostridia bacterium]